MENNKTYLYSVTWLEREKMVMPCKNIDEVLKTVKKLLENNHRGNIDIHPIYK